LLVRISNLVLKELTQFWRDWLMTTFILTLPVLQLVLLGLNTGARISSLPVAVLDLDRSDVSRQIVSTLDNRRELTVCQFPATVAETHHMLDQGDATLVVIIPTAFAADLMAPARMPKIQLIVDASNSVAGSSALGSAQGAVTAFADSLATEKGLATKPTIDLRTSVRFNPTFNFRFFSIPAQVGFIIYQVTLTVASIGLARERELGTLEQLIVMPLRRFELLIGKAVPAGVVGGLNFILMLVVTVVVFRVPMRGSLILLFALTLLFIATEISYGILISGVARTQQQAILFVFVLAMVDMAFSGYMVRIKNLPQALQTIAQAVPFYHYLTIIRGVMLKGAGLDVLWPHAAAILLMGLLVSVVAVRNLSRSLD
jgi:ABC-2 type transport system permease protein